MATWPAASRGEGFTRLRRPRSVGFRKNLFLIANEIKMLELNDNQRGLTMISSWNDGGQSHLVSDVK